MSRVLICLIALACGPCCSPLSAADLYRLDWSKIGQVSNQIRTRQQNDVLSITTDGQDPFFRFEIPELAKSDRDWILELEYFCPQGIQGLEWRSGPGINKPPAVALPAMASAEGWTTYSLNLNEIASDVIAARRSMPARIDLGRVAGVRLQVRNIIIRPINDRELATQNVAAQRTLIKQQLADRIDAYQSRKWPAKIDSVTFDETQIGIVGRFDSADDLAMPFVIARHPNSVSANDPTIGELEQRWPITVRKDGRSFQIAIPSTDKSNWNAAGTRFQLFDQWDGSVTAISSAVYITTRSVANPAPPKALQAAKGLTCITSRFSPEQLRELGLEHASVNLLLSGVVSPTQRNGWKPRQINGRTWWVNENRLRNNDRDIRTATDGGMVVAAILLIPTSMHHPSPIAHPESTTAGIYAMPNLTRRDSVSLYAATLEVLGERYGGSHPEYGRIDHWIVHNEVDYGWQWTNMGDQPMAVFMDHYVRSMRLVDAATRKFNPHARTFISLTHRWNTTTNQHWKTYAPKQMIQWLIKNSRLEGGFLWGVAYHPYPQSLWEADFWNDTRVSDDFDTELITLKNLQVLDRFMHLPSSRTEDGLVRPVILSEQGYHADQSDPQQLRIQAAALLLTWKKLRECPSILAFDYHRPSDHPNEGGLRLGLRGLPTATSPLGEPKPAWEVFSAIGTDQEADFVKEYRPVWESAN